MNNPEDITFHLLHLSLLREYIDWEFESLKVLYDLQISTLLTHWELQSICRIFGGTSAKGNFEI